MYDGRRGETIRNWEGEQNMGMGRKETEKRGQRRILNRVQREMPWIGGQKGRCQAMSEMYMLVDDTTFKHPQRGFHSPRSSVGDGVGCRSERSYR